MVTMSICNPSVEYIQSLKQTQCESNEGLWELIYK